MNARGIVASLLFSCGILFTGCTVGPDYERPDVSMPGDWRVNYSTAEDIINTKWWQQFNDPVLDKLIETALQENLDIRIAAGRVNEFLGALKTTRSQYFPQLGANASATRSEFSEDNFDFGSQSGQDDYYDQYQAALGASWQLDLFGRVRRQSESAQAQVYASEQGRRGVIISVVTGVTSSYVVLRGLDRQLEIAQKTAFSYKESADLFKLRRRYGTASMYEVSQVESQYQQALATIPTIEAQIAAQENLLSILLGRQPDEIDRGKTLDDMTPLTVPSELPSSLLTRRPDIQQAEQILISANADIGAAKSLYYPDISITGAFGQSSSDLGDLLDSSANFWNVGAQLSLPIFTFGRIEGLVMSTEAARQQAEDNYRLTILNALREVNDALVSSNKNALAYDALLNRQNALSTYARLANLRFENGASSYLEVLYANNELFGAEIQTVNAQIERYNALISVYTSMGGGWIDEASLIAEPPVDPSQSDSAKPE